MSAANKIKNLFEILFKERVVIGYLGKVVQGILKKILGNSRANDNKKISLKLNVNFSFKKSPLFGLNIIMDREENKCECNA